VTGVYGLAVEFGGLDAGLGIGDRVLLTSRDQRVIPAEIVGFRGRIARAMAFRELQGVGPGSLVSVGLPIGRQGASSRQASLSPSAAWLGRVIDPF
jgi:flagellar biosynthesis/type III secretory pathway ATPase